MYFWMYTCRYNYYIHIIHTLLLEAAAITENKKNTWAKLSHSWSAFSGSPLPPRTFSHWPMKRFSWHPGRIGASTSTISLPARWVAPKPLSETSQQMSWILRVWRCVKGCVNVYKSMFLLVVSFVECLSIVILALKVADWTKLTSCLY